MRPLGTDLEPLQGSFRDLHGLLKGRGNGRRLSIEEMNEAIVEAGTAAGIGQK